MLRRKYGVDAVSTLDDHSLGEEGRYFTLSGALRRAQQLNYLRIMSNFQGFKYVVTLDGVRVKEEY